MQDWNTPDHHIADTDHGILRFAGDVDLVLADWEFTENAPDADGRVYASVRGWLVNGTGTGKVSDRYTEPLEAGRARLVRGELRGRQALTDLNVHIGYDTPVQPYPNTWDHPGCLVTVSWMDRRIDADGHPVPETEIGRTQWTHPDTSQVFDLTAAYVPAGKFYDPARPSFTWQHYDHWSGGVPVLHLFHGDASAPSRGFGSSGRLITDGEWVKTTDAPRLTEHPIPAGS
ncbi:hypothetical protein [Streptomyces sp. NRRL F-5123]|uniref:hypothetical protein n=1 Tax=Streptomyces sp. NRRL F-5123 TaxID=1463856 RepID=UPI0004E16E4E|nr:hypothetical protein [Streptomyces sp. NRRL F-5123]